MKIDTSKPVMITGATGYIAGPIVKELLEAGLTVHCPVRDTENKYTLKYLTDIADASDGSIKFFMANLLDQGSYLKSMQGCSVVIHTSSPSFFGASKEEAEEKLYKPTVQGTRNVLESAAQTPSVTRVVITSSISAMFTDPADCRDAPSGVITEDCYNTTASPDYNPCAYFKALAEKEAWNTANAQYHYKLVTLHPSWLLGPGLKVHPSAESYILFKSWGDGQMAKGAPNAGIVMVDVRDVAKAHVAAAFSPGVQGRYLIHAECTTILDVAAALAPKFPEYPLPKKTTPKWLFWLIAPMLGHITRREVTRTVGHMANIDNSKSRKELDLEYRPMETTVQEMFQQMVNADYIPAPDKK